MATDTIATEDSGERRESGQGSEGEGITAMPRRQEGALRERE